MAKMSLEQRVATLETLGKSLTYALGQADGQITDLTQRVAAVEAAHAEHASLLADAGLSFDPLGGYTEVAVALLTCITEIVKGQTPEQKATIWGWYIQDVQALRKLFGLDASV